MAAALASPAQQAQGRAAAMTVDSPRFATIFNNVVKHVSGMATQWPTYAFIQLDHAHLREWFGRSKPDLGRAVELARALNQHAAERYDDILMENSFPESGGNMFNDTKKVIGDNRHIRLSNKWYTALKGQNKGTNKTTLQAVLTGEMHGQAGPPTSSLQWCWGPLAPPPPPVPPPAKWKLTLPVTDECKNRLKDLLYFDDNFFPEHCLMHYLKQHFRHHILRNAYEAMNKSIAWIGEVQMDEDENPHPKAILFNTGLLNKDDRSCQLLMLCVANRTPVKQINQSMTLYAPWFGVRVVLSSELTFPYRMKEHLRESCGQMTDEQAVLVNEENEVMVPESMSKGMRKEDMLFDASAYPQRVNLGDFVRHVKDKEVRIPRCFKDMSADDLLGRVHWAFERACDYPNIAIPQWFCDKNAERGSVQLILPMTLQAPPALMPALGLVLQPIRNRNGLVSYNVQTALSLDMVLNNVLVMQPRGGHWLTPSLVGLLHDEGLADSGVGDGSSSDLDD